MIRFKCAIHVLIDFNLNGRVGNPEALQTYGERPPEALKFTVVIGEYCVNGPMLAGVMVMTGQPTAML